MGTLTSYLIEQCQPICGLILGVAMLVFTFLINLGNTKIIATRLIKNTFYHNSENSTHLTMKFLDGISKYFVVLGLMLIILSIYFLQNIK